MLSLGTLPAAGTIGLGPVGLVRRRPEAEHGILTFEEDGGEREYQGYAPGYLQMQVEWVLRQDAAQSLDAGA